jgi:hypothetical protein
MTHFMSGNARGTRCTTVVNIFGKIQRLIQGIVIIRKKTMSFLNTDIKNTCISKNCGGDLSPVMPLVICTFWPALNREETIAETMPERARLASRIIM